MLTNRLLLLLWLILGIGLRLINLTAKPPWTDEFSTLVFSLGNSFLRVPLNQAIDINVLLQPLQPQSTHGIQDVVTRLLTESNHPPLYFVLDHLWLRLFPPVAGLVSLWGARSLAAFLGAVSIPAIYALSWLMFRSRVVSHLAAVMMAVSPFGIFLAQEARHYTLAILWVIASLACLVIATRHIQNRTQLPIKVTIFWIVINALGIASHYFFVLTLCAEAIVLFWFLIWDWRLSNSFKSWWRIYAVAAGTAVSGLIWVPIFLHNQYGNKLTDWITGGRSGITWISPIFQALAAWIGMICLLPVEAPQLWIILISGFVMLIFFIWATPIVLAGMKVNLVKPETRLETQVFCGVIGSAIALFFILTYFFNIDLTRGARYNFVYFPAVIVLLGASLGVCWNNNIPSRWGISGKKAVVLILLMGFLGSITVVTGLGYNKYYRPDLFLQVVQKTSKVPLLIATTHKTHVQIGEMMGIAWEYKFAFSSSSLPTSLFLLAHQEQKNSNTATLTLENTLKDIPRPFDLWLVNFYAHESEEVKKCVADTQSLPEINGYEYKIYHCL